jgi:hypothetical protein
VINFRITSKGSGGTLKKFNILPRPRTVGRALSLREGQKHGAQLKPNQLVRLTPEVPNKRTQYQDGVL